MRVLVVVAGMTLGLSGCISGGIIQRAPAGNDTVEEGDASAVEQAPWQLNGTVGAKDGAGDQSRKDGAGGIQKGGSGGGGSGGAGDPGGSGGSDDPGYNDTEEPGSGGSELDDITDQAPTEGAASADGILDGAGDAVDEGTDPNAPKDPLGDTDDASVGVPVQSGGGVGGVGGTPKGIPNTETEMLA